MNDTLEGIIINSGPISAACIIMSSSIEAIYVKEEPDCVDDSHSLTALSSNWQTACDESDESKKLLQSTEIKTEDLDHSDTCADDYDADNAAASTTETLHDIKGDSSSLCVTYVAVPGLIENDDCNSHSSEWSSGDPASISRLPLEVTMTDMPSGVKALRCVLCDFTCHDENDLTKHVSIIHLECEPILCDLCDYVTSHKKYYNLHMSQVHPTIRPRNQTNKLNLGNKPFLCDQCDFATSRKKYLSLHVSQVHSTIRPHKCTHCDYAAARKGSLNEHISQVHLNVKPFQCPECNYASARRRTLKTHMASTHSNEKPFKCNKCDYSAGLKSSLSEHISSVHLNIKPFQCFECDYATCKKSNLKSHMISVHYKAKPFKCDKCNYSSVRKSFLKKHMSKMHSSEVSDVMYVG